MTQGTETLSDFIARRRKELDQAEKALKANLNAIEDERAQLDAAEQAAREFFSMGATVTITPMSQTKEWGYLGARRVRSNAVAPEKTIKEAVIAVLSEAGHGMTALDILGAINSKLGLQYPRTSLSPQLSRLKSEGKLDRTGNVWSLRAPKEKVADDQSVGDTSATLFPDHKQDREAGPGGGT